MEKIFKKSLALVLSAALCLTALLGCLTVSAEGTTAKPTYALNAVEGKPGDTVTVTANITNVSEVCAHLIDIVFPTDFTVNGVTDSNNQAYLEFADWEAGGADAEKGVYRLYTEADGVHVRMVEFMNWPGSGNTVVASLSLFFNVTIPAGATPGDYDVKVSKLESATYEEQLLAIQTTNGKITVNAATTEPVEITNKLLAHNLYLSASVGSEIAVNVSAKNGLTTLGYSDYYLTIEYNHYISGYKLEAAEPITLLPSQRYRQNTAGTVDYFTFTSLALYEMPLDYTVTLYLKNESGDTVAFKKDTTSVVTQALTYTKKYSTDAQLLCMMVDMVNYGAAVQEFFAKVNPSSDIATAVLPTVGFEEYQNYASSSDVLPEQFNNIKSLEKVVTESTLNATSTVIIGASNNIEYTFLANDYDQSKLVAEIEYIDSYNRTIKDKINFTDMERKVSPKGNVTYRCIFDKLAIYDAEKTVSVKLINDGIQEATYTYSLGNFVNSYIKTEGFTDMLTKMELFSRSARIKLVGE